MYVRQRQRCWVTDLDCLSSRDGDLPSTSHITKLPRLFDFSPHLIPAPSTHRFTVQAHDDMPDYSLYRPPLMEIEPTPFMLRATELLDNPQPREAFPPNPYIPDIDKCCICKRTAYTTYYWSEDFPDVDRDCYKLLKLNQRSKLQPGPGVTCCVCTDTLTKGWYHIDGEFVSEPPAGVGLNSAQACQDCVFFSCDCGSLVTSRGVTYVDPEHCVCPTCMREETSAATKQESRPIKQPSKQKVSAKKTKSLAKKKKSSAAKEDTETTKNDSPAAKAHTEATKNEFSATEHESTVPSTNDKLSLQGLSLGP